MPAPLSTSDRSAVESLVVRALDAIGLDHGLGHTEVRLTPAGPRIVELNPRQGGGFVFDLVHLVTGVHPLRLLVDLALGREPTPAAPAATSAAVVFVMSPVDGRLRGVTGTDRLATDPRIAHWELAPPGPVTRPADNNARLGHILTADPHGDRAGVWAQAAATDLRLDIDDHDPVAPLTPETTGRARQGPAAHHG